MNAEWLYHYFERETGPFRNLSDLSPEEAMAIHTQLKKRKDVFASKRSDDYYIIRRQLEEEARRRFIAKGGRPIRLRPHYMTLGECPWIKEWYREGQELNIHIREFDPKTVSFTYGDLFPTMRYKDGKPYREQIYTKEEIFKVIEQYGWPQEWNKDGSQGPEMYIEVQVWDDKPLLKHISQGER